MNALEPAFAALLESPGMQFFTIVASLLISSAVMAQTTNSSESNAKFAKLSEEFIHETLALSPASASQAGYHQHVDSKTGKTIALDALLDDVSPAGVEEQRRVYTRWRERFRAETPLKSLGVEDASDWQLIDDQIGLNLLELDRIQNYKHNPTGYVELLGSALFQPLTNDYAAKEVRLAHVLSRIAAIPRFLDQVRGELLDADPIFIKVAVGENDGTIDLVQNTVAAAIPAGSDLKAKYDQVAPPGDRSAQEFLPLASGRSGQAQDRPNLAFGKRLLRRKIPPGDGNSGHA